MAKAEAPLNPKPPLKGRALSRRTRIDREGQRVSTTWRTVAKSNASPLKDISLEAPSSTLAMTPCDTVKPIPKACIRSGRSARTMRNIPERLPGANADACMKNPKEEVEKPVFYKNASDGNASDLRSLGRFESTEMEERWKIALMPSSSVPESSAPPPHWSWQGSVIAASVWIVSRPPAMDRPRIRVRSSACTIRPSTESLWLGRAITTGTIGRNISKPPPRTKPLASSNAGVW